MKKSNLTYEFVEGQDEQVIELSNGRRAYLRDDGDFETMQNGRIDGVYKIVRGTGWVERIA